MQPTTPRVPVVPMLDTEAMALRLGMTPGYVRRLCASGEIPAVRVGKRQYRIDAEAFEAWLRSRSGAPASEVRP